MWRSLFFSVVLLATPVGVFAALPTPNDLQPCDKYHLVFNASTTHHALSSNIGNYNQLVQTAANGAGIGESLGVTWKAILSTPFVHAKDNAVIGAETPVYNMQLE